ncbi:unnamed protein product [Soboliphyme baturini]|uniref:non-specific protein-tyrosine kinase n=1 Tax=Soboliphyme baturini TaxID=241478 RepID=A0A183IEA4_9BILA|nr:unnamed protein product [Soboliphyme baturini]
MSCDWWSLSYVTTANCDEDQDSIKDSVTIENSHGSLKQRSQRQSPRLALWTTTVVGLVSKISVAFLLFEFVCSNSFVHDLPLSVKREVIFPALPTLCLFVSPVGHRRSIISTEPSSLALTSSCAPAAVRRRPADMKDLSAKQNPLQPTLYDLLAEADLTAYFSSLKMHLKVRNVLVALVIVFMAAVEAVRLCADSRLHLPLMLILANRFQVENSEHLKFVSDSDLSEVGMSKPEQRRLLKTYQKYYPGSYFGRLKQVIKSYDLSRIRHRSRRDVIVCLLCFVWLCFFFDYVLFLPLQNVDHRTLP